MIDVVVMCDEFMFEDFYVVVECNWQWGCWGLDDEIGILNYVSGVMIVEVVKLVCRGKFFGLVMNYDVVGLQCLVVGLKCFNLVYSFFVIGIDCCLDMSEFWFICGVDDMIMMLL